MNNYKITSPEIQDAVAFFREKNYGGAKAKKRRETERELEKRIAHYERVIKAMMTEKEKRDCNVKTNTAQMLALMRRLTAVNGRDMKRAVALIVYWDRFSTLPAGIVDEMTRDWRVAMFMRGLFAAGNVKCMNKCAGTKDLERELVKFGYGASAEERAAVKSEYAKPDKPAGQEDDGAADVETDVEEIN